MAFDIRLLGGMTVFSAVVESGSFVSAGVPLGMTQSGVSRSIQRLEERLGVRLFERSPRVVKITAEGRRFYEEVKPLLDRLEETADAASGAVTSVRGLIRINVDASFARFVLASRLGGFMDLHPELSVEICVRSGIGDMVEEGFDVALRYGEPAPSALIARRLTRTRVLTCASPAYLKRRGRPSRPKDLGAGHHECLLFQNPATQRPFPWEFHRGKKVITVPVSGRLVFDDGLAQLDACVGGCGVAQVFETGTAGYLKNKQLINLFPDWTDEMFPLYIFHPSRHYVPAKVKAFQAFLQEILPAA